MSKLCELCQKQSASESVYNIDLCEECYNGFMSVLQNDIEALERFGNPNNFPNATEQAKEDIIGLARSTYSSMGGNVIKEIKHQQYAKSFNEFYEYDVVTILNENHGRVDKEKMKQVLYEYARNGWKLHTMYSNELGKNAIAILGLGVNATACEDVLIFERRIERLE